MDRQSTHRENADGEQHTGPVGAFATVASNLFALLANRAELAVLELGEIRDNLARLLLIGALGVIALLFAVAGWTALLVLLAWDAMGWTVLLLVAAMYTLLAIALLRHVRAMLAQGKLSLRATMDELRKDRDALL